ncbi:MAG: ferredoxin reductase, partial [Kofleriaceae bacterium]
WTRLGEVASLVATPLLPSHYVALFAPLATSRTRQARVEAVRDEVAGVVTITLRPARGWRTHTPGQHVRVGIAVEGRIATRTYTISSPPDRRDGCITITVKAQGRASQALHDLEVGTFVTLGPAIGDFVLPAGAPVRPLFVTAGSGITPIASMLRSLATSGHMLDIVHVHFTRGEMIFGAELRQLAATHPSYRTIVIDTASDPRRLTIARLAELVPDWTAREAWVCGPAPLLAAITDAFADRPHALHLERFRAALAPLPATALGGEAHFTARAKVRADGRTPLLRIAEAAGLAPAHGCRMGICHSCDSTLVSGCVRDLRTGATITEPGTQIQICVCAAAGDVEVTLQGDIQ